MDNSQKSIDTLDLMAVLLSYLSLHNYEENQKQNIKLNVIIYDMERKLERQEKLLEKILRKIEGVNDGN